MLKLFNLKYFTNPNTDAGYENPRKINVLNKKVLIYFSEPEYHLRYRL